MIEILTNNILLLTGVFYSSNFKNLDSMVLKIFYPTYFTKSQDKRGFLTSVWFGVGSVELLAHHSHVEPINVPSIVAEQRDICLDDLHLRTD